MKTVLFYPTFRDMQPWQWFPFPFLTIGAYLEKRGVGVEIVDARVDPHWRGTLFNALIDADFLGVTSTTSPDILQALEACKMAKEFEITTVWGGPHANVCPEETLANPLVDSVCVGPGENTLLPWPKGIFQGSLDINLMPAYHLIDMEKYRSPNNVAALFSVWGCPHACTFCDTSSAFLGATRRVGFRYFPMDRVKKEILYLVEEKGFKNLFFHDGTFFLRKPRVMRLASFLGDLGVKWKAKARTNSLLRYTTKELKALKSSGLVSIFLGVESGSPQMLKRMNKHVSVMDTFESLRRCKYHGFEFYTAFMAAMPHETVEDLKKTINLIKHIKHEVPNDPLQIGLYTSIPGTQMYRETIELGHKPPTTLQDWGYQDVSSDWDRRPDIREWMPNYDEYRKVFEAELGPVKWAWEREEEGTLKSPFKEGS